MADRHADQHPPDRLPPFLRPALCRRYRPARAPRSSAARTASRAITSISAAAPPRPPSRRWRASMRKDVAYDDLPPLLETLLRGLPRAPPGPGRDRSSNSAVGTRSPSAQLADARRCGRWRMNAIAPLPSLIPENAPFSTDAARLAERLLLGLSRCRRRDDRGQRERRTGRARGFPLARRGARDAGAAGARQGGQARPPS